MLFRVIVIMTVTGNPSQYNTLIFNIPFIDRQHEESFPDAPGVGQRRDEGRVDHIPDLAVVLHLLPDDAVDMCHALPYSIATELRKDVWHRYIVPLAGFLDITYDLIDHELVVVFKTQRMLDREATADIDRIQLGTDLLELAVKVNDLVQFAPVIDIVLDPFVEEDVQHLQL